MPLQPEPPATVTPPRMIVCAGAVLVLAILAAFANSLSGPFVYDDKPSIALNPTIRSLWPVWEALTPPAGGITVSGRPGLNFSFALDYAAGGLAVRGYHLTNLAIHALAALALFGIVRRTLLLPSMRGRLASESAALPLAFAATLLWSLHPLQTESVTYIVQRAESLMGLFYFLTLYCVIRALAPDAPRRWIFFAIGACALGMSTKENMVSAPVLALLYDRTFVAGTFSEAWRRRRGLYAGLAATSLLLAALVIGNGVNRAGSMGFTAGVSWWSYVLTQFSPLIRYLALLFWPRPLVFDYGPVLAGSLSHVALAAAVAIALVAATLVALWRRPAIGFLGAWFFAILAPTFLIPAKIQMIAEHRMYLPLAAIVVAVVMVVQRWAGWKQSVAALTGVAIVLGVLTARRNDVYHDEITLWSDTVAKRPDNALAHSNLASAFADAHRLEESIAQNREALRLQPDLPPALATLGSALAESGQLDEALPLLEKAALLDPTNAQIFLDLGIALDLLGRPAEALSRYEAAVRLGPLLDSARNSLGDALCRAGHPTEGIAQLEEALRLNSAGAEAHFNLSTALVAAGHVAEATAHFETGFRLQSADPAPLSRWANVLFTAGHRSEALVAHDQVVRGWPGFADGHFNYGIALTTLGRSADALREFEAAVRLQPGDAMAQSTLGNSLLALERPAEALPHFEAALRLAPNNPTAHGNLGLALARLGRLREALPHFETAVRLAPDDPEARKNLAQAQVNLARPAPEK
jgi:tetratricopeptide (TPR) repeat protein